MIRLISLAFFLLLSFTTSAQFRVEKLLTENLTNPIGLDVNVPRLSWQLVSDERNVVQTAYEVNVFQSLNDKSVLWTSGKVPSNQSVHVPYGGPALKSDKRYYWKVRVWNGNNKASEWSAPAFWQMAMLSTSDWKAKWIQSPVDSETSQTNPIFRRTFSSQKKIQSATAYITAHGVYESHINGQRIGDAYLTPGWTSYNKRLQYQVYDVTNLVRQGSNSVGMMLGNGWYRGFIGFEGQKNFYGKDLSLLFQMNIVYADGTAETIISDGSWKSSTGSVVSS